MARRDGEKTAFENQNNEQIRNSYASFKCFGKYGGSFECK